MDNGSIKNKMDEKGRCNIAKGALAGKRDKEIKSDWGGSSKKTGKI